MSAPYAELAHRFLRVAEAGSIQAAARALNISQPSLTQSVRRIEGLFGARLFERTRRGVVLTPMGERLYARSARMLRELDLARAEIADMRDDQRGVLRLSAGTAWGHCYLPPLIRTLQSRYADLTVELNIALTEEALPRLRAGTVDAYLGADAPGFAETDGFARQPLRPIDYAAACGPEAPLATLSRVALEDFADTPVILYQDDANLMDQVVARIEQRIGKPVTVAVRTKSLLATLELVRDGPYVTFLAEPFLAKFANTGLCLLELDRPLHRFPTAIFYRESLLHTPSFCSLLAMLEPFQVGTDVAESSR